MSAGWTTKSEQTLKQAYLAGGSEAARNVLPEKSWPAKRRKLQRMGLTPGVTAAKRAMKWGIHEEVRLLKYYPQGGSRLVQLHLPEWSESEIERRAQEKRLTHDPQSLNDSPHGAWRPEEVDLLKSVWMGGLTAAKAVLRRSDAAIQNMAEVMGLTEEKEFADELAFWTAERDEGLIRMMSAYGLSFCLRHFERSEDEIVERCELLDVEVISTQEAVKRSRQGAGPEGDSLGGRTEK